MTVQKKILDLTGTQYLVQKITGEIPVKISDLQDDVDMLTSHEDIHLENLPNDSPNIIFENNTPSYTWREMPHGFDLIDWSYYGDPYNKELTFLTSSSKITYKNNSNSQNTCELAFGQSKIETKTILTMNYYYGSNDTNEPDDDSNYVSSSLVFTLNPGYNNLASSTSTFDETEYSYSDASPDSDNYYLGRKNPFKEICAKDFKIVYEGDSEGFSLISILEDIRRYLGPHLADTDIHVTTADKNKWNNGVTQSYVFRYSSTALTASSTNSNALLDNTDNLKVGDKVIDSNGVLFSITAIDTANSTFTIGTALIDLAQDSDVVHKSGDETKSGELTLSDTLNSSDIVPIANNSYSLGSSNNQWNNLYAKNYYYNGTAWGLDKANVWSANNKFTGNVTIEKNSDSPTASSDTSLALTGTSQYIFFRTKGSFNYKSYNSFLWGGYLNGAAPYRFGRIRLYRASAIYGETGEETPDTSFSFIDVALHYKWVSLTDNVKFINDETTNACQPLTDNATDLGTSTNKWKSLNGINPGALSLPDLSNGIDISGYINTGDSDNSYTPLADGYISVRANSTNSCALYASQGDVYISSYGNIVDVDLGGYICSLFIPVVKNVACRIVCRRAQTIVSAKFFPCLGNV